MTFHEPSVWFLFLVVLAPLVWWRSVSMRRRPAVTFSSVGLLGKAGTSWAVHARWLLPILRTVAVLGLVICIARPQVADKRTEITTEGIAIELIVDRSGSMAAMDLNLKADQSRLDVAKEAVERFVLGNDEDDDDDENADDLPGRPNDLIGLVVFGSFADSVCPMTLDHEHVAAAIRQTTVAQEESEAQTAIGDAIALGVERLRALTERTQRTNDRAISSRVIILLTDGENNTGDFDPLTAAQMAQAFDIRIYTVGIGSNRGNARALFRDRNGRLVPGTVSPVDEETLREVAAITGGRYFRATDSDSLARIYARIDKLETTEFQQNRYTQFYEPAVEPVVLGGRAIPPFLLIVFMILAIELLLSSTRLRPLP